ncbi:hypothetical protein RJ640_017053 [Escallonia rubra]|uniref:Response regulatory domain-containing protein n=1 Tax=Escallonia rubra TaxID=112253 RepID=A0AA88QWP6_9ASTE|nr:hypothetical protein RJ640_017053 [Escallonia rubra]
MIITDYCTPGMTGYCMRIYIQLLHCFGYKHESSILKEVPVVIMSSEHIPTRIHKCLQEGAQMFMLKHLKH